MSDEINKSINSIMETVTTYRDKVENIEKDAVTKAEVVNIETALKQDLADLRELVAQKQAAPLVESMEDKVEQAKKAFAEALDKGVDGFREWVRKDASVASFSTDSAGGAIFPTVLSSEITGILAKYSPVYGAATKVSNAKFEKLIKESTGGAATRIDENGSRATQDAGKYATLTLGTKEIYGEQAYTTWMADNGGIVSIVDQIRGDILQNMADQLSDMLLNGTETNTLVTSAATLTPAVGLRSMTVQANANRFTNEMGKIGGVETAANKAVGFDDLFNLRGAVASTHLRNSMYVFGSDVELALIKTKASGSGEYIWGVEGQITTDANPFTIGGYRYVVDDFFPALSGMANNKVVALFGDFSKVIVNEVAPISWLVNPYMTRGQVILSARTRVGAALVDYSAIRALTNKASA